MFINFHRTMAFMKEMFTFSCYNHLNSLIMMNAFRNFGGFSVMQKLVRKKTN